MPEKVTGPVEELRKFIENLPKEPERGLLSAEPTKAEAQKSDRYERMTALVKIAELKLSTLSYLGAAKEYIDQIESEDKSIARAFKVVVATQALQDIVNVHSDLELLRSEARKLYTDAGITVPVDALTGTFDALAKLIKTAIEKSTLAKPSEA